MIRPKFQFLNTNAKMALLKSLRNTVIGSVFFNYTYLLITTYTLRYSYDFLKSKYKFYCFALLLGLRNLGAILAGPQRNYHHARQ